MTLAAGTRLGPYTVVAPLGAGGMGEVYRARDTSLNRDVALKILPDVFASDPDRLARFTREAHTLAALNHPNVAQIYGLADAGPIRAIVMELVAGEDLSERLTRGALPIDEALLIARQIAEALEAAHEQGVVHRDLKPANVKLRDDGTVKVLDFGLAKATDGPPGATDGLSLSPTITSPALVTGVGVLLGTAAYMSPEQARGRAADKRTDIWAFGCVLFELLTGRALFTGDTVTEVLASVMKDAPPLDRLPTATPSAVARVLRRCLERDPQQRLRDIGEARIALVAALAGTPDEAAASPAPVSARAAMLPRSAWLAWTAAVGAIVVAWGVVSSWAPWREAAPPPAVRLSTELGADVSLVTDFGAAAVLSPDGSTLVFAAQPAASEPSQLYLRRLDSLQASAIPGTLGARDPFFSPNGEWIAFFADGKLKKVALTGGAPIMLADAQNPRGGTWSAEDDSIVFQPINAAGAGFGVLMRVPASGGTVERLVPLSGDEVTQRWPDVLPGGAVLFTSHTNTTSGYEDASIVVQPFPSGERKVLVQGGYFAQYVPTGHLVYVHEGTLFAAPFDVERLELTGQAAPIIEGLATSAVFGGAQFSIADNGTLVYLPGQIVTREVDVRPLMLFDRDGRSSELRAEPAAWFDIQFAPDGNRIAASVGQDASLDIWVLDTAKDILSRLTFGAQAKSNPVFTPDGTRIAYVEGRQIYWQRADGGDTPQQLTTRNSGKGVLSFHPSGRWLAWGDYNTQSNTIIDIVVMPLDGDDSEGWTPGEPTAFLASPAVERDPAFSLDGRWIAYSSEETGRPEIYVRPFPGPGGKWQISTAGGRYPAWSRARQELLYAVPTPGGSDIMAAPYVVNGSAFVAERPRPWLTGRVGSGPWTLHPDGARIAGTAATAASEQPVVKQDKVVVVLNFFGELRRTGGRGGN